MFWVPGQPAIKSEGRILADHPVSIPMPAVTPPKPSEDVLHFQADHTAFAGALIVRGIKTPIGGWAPGSYQARCATCREIHVGCDKRSTRCLPCSIVSALDAAEGARAVADAQGYRRGRQSFIDDVRKLEASS